MQDPLTYCLGEPKPTQFFRSWKFSFISKKEIKTKTSKKFSILQTNQSREIR